MENLEHVLGALNACIGTQRNRLKSQDDRIQELWDELRKAEAINEEIIEELESLRHMNKDI
jgi:hypothetical protein